MAGCEYDCRFQEKGQAISRNDCRTPVMPLINAAIVAYNRPSSIQKLIQSLTTQSYPLNRIIVIDNSTASDVSNVVAAFCGKNITYKKMPENIGSAGGFRECLVEGVKDADYVWLFDDDVDIEPDSLAQLVRWIPELNKNDKLGALRSWYGKDVSAIPEQIHNFAWRGTLINKIVCEYIGFPDASLFLYSDDVDYALKIDKAGFQMYRVPSSYMFVNAPPTKKTGNLFGMQYEYHESPFRLYYAARNEIAVSIRYRDVTRMFRAGLYCFKILIMLIIFEKKDKRLFVKAVGTGLWHGIIGRLGKSDIFKSSVK